MATARHRLAAATPAPEHGAILGRIRQVEASLEVPTILAVAVADRHTGIVGRRDGELLAMWLRDRWLLDRYGLAGMVRELVAMVDQLASGHSGATIATTDLPPMLPRNGLTWPALVAGALLAVGPVHLVPLWGYPTSRYGAWPLDRYPPALVGVRERGVYGRGRLRACRVAWDLAGQAAADVTGSARSTWRWPPGSTTTRRGGGPDVA
jgi:hypothetical protein